MNLQEAIDVFCEGFAYTRGFTHPCEVLKEGLLWIMRDAPRRSGTYRAEEIVVTGTPPTEVFAAIQKYNPGRYFLCVVSSLQDSPAEAKKAYKGLGYRLMRSEPMFIRSLENIPAFEGPLSVDRADSLEVAEKIFKGAGAHQILPRHIGVQNCPLRLFYAHYGGTPAGWVRSIATGHGAAWVSNMFVRSEYRRKGIGRSLMTAMLLDDQKRGIETSVLLASEAGSHLYRVLGYEQIGLLQLYAPPRGAASPRS